MKRKIFLSIVGIIAVIAAVAAVDKSEIISSGVAHASPFTYKHATLTIAGQNFDAFVADNDVLQDKGLGDRDSLPADEAMLFVFDTPSDEGFWMKDMRFPIDMVWLDPDFHVVWIESNVSPDTYPKTYAPPTPALYVVETNAGVMEKYGIEVGDTIQVSDLSR